MTPPTKNSATENGTGTSPPQHHHRRVYSAVEGSLAQEALLEGTRLHNSTTGTNAASANKSTTKISEEAAQMTTPTTTTEQWNEMAQMRGEGLLADARAAREQLDDVDRFGKEAARGASEEEDLEVQEQKKVSTPTSSLHGPTSSDGFGGGGKAAAAEEFATPKTTGAAAAALYEDVGDQQRYVDGISAPDLPPLSGAATGGGICGAVSVTSSTRSIPGSLVRPASAGGIGGYTPTSSAPASRTYTDIIEDEKADHRDTEDLEGLSINYGGDDDDIDSNSIISGVTTWAGTGAKDDDDRSARSGRSSSRRATGPASAASRKMELDDVVETPLAKADGPRVLRSSPDHRRSSNASSKDGGESGYVSSASGGAVANEAFLQAVRGSGRSSSAGHGTSAPGTGRKSPRHAGSNSNRTKKAAAASSTAAMATGSAPHSPVTREYSPSSFDDLPSTPTRTGGSIQGSLSNLGTAGVAGVVPPPLGVSGGGGGAASAAAVSSVNTIEAGGTNELLLSAITELRGHVDRTLDGVRDQNRSDFERVLSIMQSESSKRSSLESRLHAQLLLQSEAMVAMEMKLMRLEAKVEGKGKGQSPGQTHHQPHGRGGTAGPPPSVLRDSSLMSAGAMSSGPIVSSLPPISSERPYEEEDLGSLEDGGVPRAVRASRVFAASGASLASAVTDGFTVDDGSTVKSGDRDESTAPLGGDDDEGDEGGDVSVDGSASTPTFSSRHRTLDAILMDPEIRGEVSVHGASTRATRGSEDGDGDSTLATSMTSTTRGSTVFTGTSGRGETSIAVRALSGLSETAEYGGGGGSGAEDSGIGDDNPANYGLSPSPSAPNDDQNSRSNSPLTVQSRETASVGPMSIASQSVAASQMSTAVIAPHRSRAYRIRHDRAVGGASTRPLANRLVQFTTTPAELADGADEVTVPDELDNLSDVAETFARSANQWREEYEARLDAIQKRYG